MSMRIGIDLDNTILAYRDLFWTLARSRGWIAEHDPREKAGLKRALARVAGDDGEGELRWQRLQAEAYGSRIDGARVFPGFARFVETMHARGCSLHIVSHKSRTSNLDPSVDLHHWARHTLERRGFFDRLGFDRDRVFFEETRDEKVNRIASLELDIFIDDLPAVFHHPSFPARTQPILFAREPVTDLPNLPDWDAVTGFCRRFPAISESVGPIRHLQLVKAGGNNRIVRLEPRKGDPLALKTYYTHPDDPRPRVRAEHAYLDLLWNKGIARIPHPIAGLEDGLLLEWVEGEAAEPDTATREAMTRMLADLDRLSLELAGNTSVGPAAHARLRLRDFCDQIEARYDALMSHTADPARAEVQSFLNTELAPHLTRARAHFDSVCHMRGLRPDERLPADRQLLSPSDFGPHNCIRRPDGGHVFLDFEYAGWDDPAKLLCDIVGHVGHTMSRADRLAIVDGFIADRTRDPDLRDRVRAVMPMVACEWVLIVLNVALPVEHRRKGFATPDRDPATLIPERLQRAESMIAALEPDRIPL